MTWRDRLQPEIILTSPTGQTFTALWVGGPRTVEKKLGIFSYPRIAGAVVQDLDVDAVRYPLTFYFEGEDHDLDADRFFNACKERGAWRITHPVRGQLTLQLITVTEDIQPTSSANVTAINSEWIEPLDLSTVASVAEQSEAVKTQVEVVRASASQQFGGVVELDKAAKITAFKNAIGGAVTIVRNTLEPISQQSADVNAGFLSVQRGITSGLDATTLDVVGLGGQLQTLVSLPGDAIESISTKLDYYSDLIAGLLEFGPDAPSARGVNTVAVQELILTAALTTLSESVTGGELESREQAVTFLDSIAEQFATVTDALDAAQELYEGNAIDNQYFSQSETFNDTAALIGRVAALLLRRSFDLAAAKRITLTRERAPVEIAATEYGDLDHLDFFISSNRLKAYEILLLPAGRELVVYL